MRNSKGMVLWGQFWRPIAVYRTKQPAGMLSEYDARGTKYEVLSIAHKDPKPNSQILDKMQQKTIKPQLSTVSQQKCSGSPLKFVSYIYHFRS